MVPRVATAKNMTTPDPHWPGESQASPVRTSVAIMPKAEGLKICFPLKRKIYLDATVRKVVSRLVVQWFVFRSRQMLMAEMSTLSPQEINPFLPLRGKIFCLLTDSNT
jgi:hypothetical protein